MVYTRLFYQIHKSGPKTPRLMSVALQGADSHLGCTLGGHCYHVNSIVHQSCFGLCEKNRKAFFNIYLCAQSLLFSTENRSLRVLLWKRSLLGSPRKSEMQNKSTNFREFSGECWEENYIGQLQEERGRCVQCRKEHMDSSVAWRGVLRSLRCYSSSGLILQACLRATHFAVLSLLQFPHGICQRLSAPQGVSVNSTMQVLQPVSAQPAGWCGTVAWCGAMWEGCPCGTCTSSLLPLFWWDCFLPRGVGRPCLPGKLIPRSTWWVSHCRVIYGL